MPTVLRHSACLTQPGSAWDACARMGLTDDLERIFAADRAAREAERAFLQTGDTAHRSAALRRAIEAASKLDDPEESAAQLERLADLCSQIPGSESVDSLIAILNEDEPAVRLAAGEALLEVAYERYAEVARGIDRALDICINGPAMSELPGILGEIGEPGAQQQLRRFLDLDDPDAIAAAIEAMAQLRDPAAADALQPFVGDHRVVVLDDADRETEATIGELATAALEIVKG